MQRSVEDLKPGERIGRYRLERELGRGAMGLVFLAEDTMLKQLLCVKVLHPALAANPEALERFNREIILARRIAHKAVCRLHDIHHDDGFRFITMEYVEGAPLRELIGNDKAPLAIARIIEIGRNICDGLAAAHDVGVVHRDLKPRNILVRGEADVTLLDFGIATALDVGSNLTLPGVALGTRHYIAPEVWAGRPATPRADQFAVGVILYNMLTGKMPFAATKEILLLEAMKKGPPVPPSVHRRDVPPALDAVVLTALAFRPEDRFDDVRALERALRECTRNVIDDIGKTVPIPQIGGRHREELSDPHQAAAPARIPTQPIPVPLDGKPKQVGYLVDPLAATAPGGVPAPGAPTVTTVHPPVGPSDTDPNGPPVTLGDVTLVTVMPARSTDENAPPAAPPANTFVPTDPASLPQSDSSASWVIGGRAVDLPARPKEISVPADAPPPARPDTLPGMKVITQDDDSLVVAGKPSWKPAAALVALLLVGGVAALVLLGDGEKPPEPAKDTLPVVTDQAPVVEDKPPVVEDTPPVVEDKPPVVENKPPDAPPDPKAPADKLPEEKPPVVADPVVEEPSDPEPEPEVAPDKPRPRTTSVKTSGERARWVEAKAALDRVMGERGLGPGDDADLDRLRGLAASAARAKRWEDAASAAADATKRAEAIVVDRSFVREKLTRFNVRFGALDDDSQAKLAPYSDAITREMTAKRWDAANRALNDAFVEIQRNSP